MKTDLDEIEKLISKWCLEIPKSVAGKGSELYRLAGNRGVTSMNPAELLPAICLNIASEQKSHPFPILDVLTFLKVKTVDYITKRDTVLDKLKLQMNPVDFETLGVRFGCNYLIKFANELLDNYKCQLNTNLSKIQYSKIDFQGKHIILAIFFVCCKAIKIPVNADQQALLGGTTKLCKEEMKRIMQYCKEFLEGLYDRVQTQTPSNRKRITRSSRSLKSTPSKLNENDYNETPSKSLRKRKQVDGDLNETTSTKKWKNLPEKKNRARKIVTGINSMINFNELSDVKLQNLQNWKTSILKLVT
ncbi:hypothetical protein BC833DRAFT_645049 [Globomyces pollinis-pini]|nr:hypothetical protein BC833DRAFT_645049 [Globomyces pollinis-pini]